MPASERGIKLWVGGWSRGGPEHRPPLVEVVPPLAEVLLVGRRTGLLGFRNGSLAYGDALLAELERLLCKSGLRLLPIYTTTVFHRVFSPDARTLRLFSRVIVSTGGMGSHRRHTGTRIVSYAASVRIAGSACIVRGNFEPRTIPTTLASRRFRKVIALPTSKVLAQLMS